MIKKIREIALINIQTLSITLLFFVATIHSMEIDKYIKKCRKIKERQEHKWRMSCESNVQSLGHQEILYYEQKLDKMKFDVEDHHNDLFRGIKIEFDMDSNKWQEVLTLANSIKEYEKKHQHLPLPGVKHDKTMPNTMKQTLKCLLNENGINPKRMSFKHLNASRYSVRSPVPVWKTVDFELIFTEEIQPGEIEICTPILLKQQEAICLIIVESIKQNHDIGINVLSSVSQPWFNLSFDIVRKSLSFKKYATNLFSIISLLVALQSQKNAALIEENFSQCTMTQLGMLQAIQHYILCAKIRRYWDTLKWLKRYGVPKKLTLPKELADKTDTTDKNERK